MNMQIKNLAIMATIGTFLLLSCSKEEFDISGTFFGNEDHIMTLERGYTSNVTSAIEASSLVQSKAESPPPAIRIFLSFKIDLFFIA